MSVSGIQRIAITGASGLVGSALRRSLLRDGHHIVSLVRRPAKPVADSTGETECQWSTTEGVLDLDRLEGVDGVVHLAGENLAGGRWTKERRRRIRESRTVGTKNLVRSLSQLQHVPECLISASAIGYYGDRGDTELTANAAPGDGFLAAVCQDWEKAASAANELDVRVVIPRLGVVLSPDGGALEKMLTPFKMGLGGPVGDGEHYFSWITIDDLVAGLRFCLDHSSLRGALNLTAPFPVKNKVFTKALGRVLRRPTVMSVPEAALRLALGDMADEALLASTRAVPDVLLNAGFEFQYPEIDAALQHLLG